MEVVVVVTLLLCPLNVILSFSIIVQDLIRPRTLIFYHRTSQEEVYVRRLWLEHRLKEH